MRSVAELPSKEQDVPKKVSKKMADSQRKKNEERDEQASMRKVVRLNEEVLSQLDKEETFNHATNLLSDGSVEVKLG